MFSTGIVAAVTARSCCKLSSNRSAMRPDAGMIGPLYGTNGNCWPWKVQEDVGLFASRALCRTTELGTMAQTARMRGSRAASSNTSSPPFDPPTTAIRSVNAGARSAAFCPSASAPNESRHSIHNGSWIRARGLFTNIPIEFRLRQTAHRDATSYPRLGRSGVSALRCAEGLLSLSM